MQPRPERFSQIVLLLEKQGIDFDFYFEDLRTGESFEAGKKLRYPFASCFKLSVLGAMLERYSDDDLLRLIQITDADVPKLAMGVVNSLDSPVQLSLSNLLRLMLAFSDGTSTDLLIRELGISAVQKFTEELTSDSKVSNNVFGLLDRLMAASLAVASNPKNITREEYRSALEASTMLEDYSNSKDLCSILKGLVRMGPRAQKYLFRDQGVQRLGMYSLDHIKLFGKTGTLGYWVSANDCAVIVVDGVPQAVVGLMTLGWKQPRYLIEHIFGQVGLMVSNLYRSEAVYSPAFGTE
jgi:hypothetical protein